MVPALMRQFAEKFYKSLTNEWVAHHVTNYMPSKTSKEGVSKAHEIENSPIMARSKCLHICFDDCEKYIIDKIIEFVLRLVWMTFESKKCSMTYASKALHSNRIKKLPTKMITWFI